MDGKEYSDFWDVRSFFFTMIISLSSPLLHGWNIADTINLNLHILPNTKGVHDMN